MSASVAVVMGSRSDYPVVQNAVTLLESFGIAVEIRVLSAHRTPEEAAAFARGARGRGVGVIIAAAGKAAHLPGVLAAYTTLRHRAAVKTSLRAYGLAGSRSSIPPGSRSPRWGWTLPRTRRCWPWRCSRLPTGSWLTGWRITGKVWPTRFWPMMRIFEKGNDR